jgi:hypothetical protein
MNDWEEGSKVIGFEKDKLEGTHGFIGILSIIIFNLFYLLILEPV